MNTFHTIDRGAPQRAVRCAVALAPATALALLAACMSAGSRAGNDSAPRTATAEGSLAAGAAARNRLSETERAAGWRLLFDGTTLRGWRVLGSPGIPPQHWLVEDGSIKKVASGKVPVQADGQPLEGGDLMTIDTFGDFELVWQWKVTPGANSGVKYNVSEELSTSMEPRHAAKGFEYQILDDDRHEDGKLATHRAGALYDLIAPNDRKRLRLVGEWNDSRLVFRGRHGEHWLNGEKIVEYDLGTAAMDSALGASKYRSISWFAVRRPGHIVLQDHGDEVYFRAMKVRLIH